MCMDMCTMSSCVYLHSNVHKLIHVHALNLCVTLPLFSACNALPAASHKQTTQHSASDGFNNTHINYVDIVVIRQSLQHLTNGGPDQFESQARHTPASATTTKYPTASCCNLSARFLYCDIWLNIIRNASALGNALHYEANLRRHVL